MSELANQKCIPCTGDVPALKRRDLTLLSGQLGFKDQEACTGMR